jgi:hypothetical protein
MGENNVDSFHWWCLTVTGETGRGNIFLQSSEKRLNSKTIHKACQEMFVGEYIVDCISYLGYMTNEEWEYDYESNKIHTEENE